MKDTINKTLSYNLKSVRMQKGWSQAFVAKQLNISIRSISRAENGCLVSKKLLKKLCSFYRIEISELYRTEIKQEKNISAVNLIPEEVVVRLMFQNTFFSDLQREAILRFNNSIQEKAVMYREDVEAILPDVISNKRSYTLGDIISCCMEVNQRTIQKIGSIAVV